MPIIRRDEQPDRLSPHIVYLWSRRWTLILPALLVTIGTYFITYLVKEEFVASAQVFVNRFSANDDEGLLPNPAAVARLLESDQLLYQVRNDFSQKFGLSPRNIPMEEFSRIFRVKSEILQDTSVKKEVSPVLELSLQAAGAEQTRFLMESWLRHFMQMFSNYFTQESVQKRDALLVENAQLEEKLASAEKELEEIRGTLPLQQKMALTLAEIIAPADLPPETKAGVALGQSEGVITGSNTQVNLTVGEKQLGLMSRLVQLSVEEKMAASGGSTRTLEQIRSEHAAVQAAIDEAMTSVSKLQEKTAVAAARADTLERQIQRMSEYQARLNQRLGYFAIGAATYQQPDGEGLTPGADLRVLSGPITPEQKVWPRRTLTALAAGLATFVFSAILLLGLRALRRASGRSSAELEPAAAPVNS